jgi:hypothetical protein
MADQAAKEVQERQLESVSYLHTHSIAVSSDSRQILKGTYGFPSFPSTTPLGNFFGSAAVVVGGTCGASFLASLPSCAGSGILSFRDQ